MPWIDVALAAAIVISLVCGVVTRRRSALWPMIAGLPVAALLVTGAVLEGARPQLIVLVVLAVLAAAVVVWARSSRSARSSRLAVASAVLLSLVAFAGATAAWALPPVFVVAGTGDYAVAIDTTVWSDDSRDAHGETVADHGETVADRGETVAGGHRSIPVTVWYPTDGEGDPAPYLPDRDHAAEFTGAVAAQYGLPAVALDSLHRARGAAIWRGNPAAGSFPIVIASPGAGSTRWFFTSWAQELASHGIVVIAVDHPYDAAAVELSDGSLALSESRSTGDDQLDQARADQDTRVRAADLRAIIDRISSGRSGLPALASADPGLIIAAGHSMGGAAAIEAARLDDRIAGVIDIDGMPRSPEGTRLAVPFLAVVAGDADDNPSYSAAIDELIADGRGARVTLDGVTHFGLVDVGLLIAPIPGVTGARGQSGPELVARATLVLVAAVTTGTELDAEALAAIGAV